MAATFDPSGRLALVTGSSRGLGLAIARGLAAAGARVLPHGRDVARLNECARDLPNAAGFLPFDVSNTQ
jgi:gluconate 5-dehydrogenase